MIPIIVGHKIGQAPSCQGSILYYIVLCPNPIHPFHAPDSADSPPFSSAPPHIPHSSMPASAATAPAPAPASPEQHRRGLSVRRLQDRRGHSRLRRLE